MHVHTCMTNRFPPNLLVGQVTSTVGHRLCMYRNLPKIRPWAMNFSGYSKRGVGLFSSVLVFYSSLSHLTIDTVTFLNLQVIL